MVRISKKNDYSSPQYNLCGNQLKAVSEVKDLEIYFTSSLSWSMQANKCANKANSVLGFIRRAVGPKNLELFSKLYKSLVCPILEYCSPIWCPHLKVTRPSFLGGTILLWSSLVSPPLLSILLSIQKSAKRGHCTRAEQECCITTD